MTLTAKSSGGALDKHIDNTIHLFHRMGALKMTGMKLQDMKLTDQVAGHELQDMKMADQIAGHENAGHEIARHLGLCT